MREEILTSRKETDATLRWDSGLGPHHWELYIPKWRVPRPWPGQIRVSIGLPAEFGSERLLLNASIDEAQLPIQVICKWVGNRTVDAVFVPVEADQLSWQIGTAYIPCALLPSSRCEQVLIEVVWDQSRPWIGVRE